MAGLAGFVAGDRTCLDLREKLECFRNVNRVPGVRLVEQGWVGVRAVLFNGQTGLFPHASEKHAEHSPTRTHLFLEGEVLNAEDLEDKAGSEERDPINPCSILDRLMKHFLEQGVSFIRRLKGEFALAVYEEHPHRLHLFTDHLSIKSIFFLVNDEGLFFGSEKKSILAAASSGVSLDPIGFLQLLSMHHNLEDRTFVSGIKRMTPGSHLVFENGKVSIRKYRRLGFHDAGQGVPSVRLLGQWRHLLAGSVRKRIRGKDRLILFLSGGLDSRAVASALAREKRPVIARTHGYRDSIEVRCASRIARKLGFAHYVDEPGRVRLSDVLEATIWRSEGEIPFTSCLSIVDHERISEHADFILGGQFGDIGSGGHIRPHMLIPQSRNQFLNELFRRYLLSSFASLKTLLTDDFLEEFYPEFQESFFASFDAVQGYTCNVELFELWDMMNRQPRYIFSSQKIDAHRFEVLAPLADFDYVEFALGLPQELRIDQVLYQSMIWSMSPEIRRVPYANNLRPVRPYALLTSESRVRYRRMDDTIAAMLRRMAADVSAPSPTLDSGFRDHIDSYLSSPAFESGVFDSRKIRTVLNGRFEEDAYPFRLLSIFFTLAVALPMFLKKRLDRCSPVAARNLIRTNVH